ncbi:hypothetical protein C1Y42_22715 [Pantoea sp. ICBG 985]|nr:hypothetical protein C1Y42_22715 [Pantoea sp. ICBG 985]
MRINCETDSTSGLLNVAELNTMGERRLSQSLTGSIVFTQKAGNESYRDSLAALQLSYRF